MIRSMLAIAAGYFSIVFLNSFIHLIVSFYFRMEITLTGISYLPTPIWTFGFTILQFLFGLFGGLLAATLAQERQNMVLTGFILLIVAVALLDYSVLNEREPLWYLITAPGLKIAGIYTGYYLQTNQTNPAPVQ
jgi:hypothetical protein